MPRKLSATQFLLCLRNDGYAASLEVRKVYQAVRDDAAEKHDLVRVSDESGEDYLYPQELFVPVELPAAAAKALAALL